MYVLAGISCYSSQQGNGITHRVFHWHSLRELLLISYISKWKRTRTHLSSAWFISTDKCGAYWLLRNSGLCWCYSWLTTKACRNQIFFGLKLRIKYKETTGVLRMVKKYGITAVCVYKSYERSKSLIANMWWADSKGATNQSATKVQNRQN